MLHIAVAFTINAQLRPHTLCSGMLPLSHCHLLLHISLILGVSLVHVQLVSNEYAYVYVLCIVVYKSSVEAATAESDMQTVAVESDQTSTQTDSSEWMQSGDTQTDSTEWSHVTGTQTDHSQWLQSEATQTDTGIESTVTSTQTDWNEWLHSADVQVDCSYWQSTVSAQTDVKQLSSDATQTKEMRIAQAFADVSVETQANLATQVIICCTFN